MDGEPDVLKAALREAREESGLADLTAVSEEIFDVDASGAPAGADGAAVLAAVRGFPITRALWDGLRGVDIVRYPFKSRARIVVSSEQSSYTRLRQAWPSVEYALVPSKGNWNDVDNFGSALVPQEIIRDIVTWFEEGAV